MIENIILNNELTITKCFFQLDKHIALQNISKKSAANHLQLLQPSAAVDADAAVDAAAAAFQNFSRISVYGQNG